MTNDGEGWAILILIPFLILFFFKRRLCRVPREIESWQHFEEKRKNVAKADFLASRGFSEA